MKRIVLILVLLLFEGAAFAATIEREVTNRTRSTSADYLLGGVHTPVVWKDVFQANPRLGGGTDSISTPWIAIQFDANVTRADSVNNTFEPLYRYAPSIFRLHMHCKEYGAGDSIFVTRARMEFAMDTTLMREIYPDTSSSFIKDGNFNQADYGVWRFEDFYATDSAAFVYPLKVWGGAYMRLWLINTQTSDTANFSQTDLESPAGGR